MEQALDNDLIGISKEEKKYFAGFWVRAGASLVDFLVLLPFVGINFYNIYSLKSTALQSGLGVVLLLYKPVMEYKYGATLGKMAMKIRIISQNSQPLDLSQVVIRTSPFWLSQLFSIVTTVIVFQDHTFQSVDSMTEVAALQNRIVPQFINTALSGFTMVSCLVVAFSEKKQGLHDMMAKTYCVYKSR